MEHAKKMVLLPYETVERLEHAQKLNSVQTPGNEMSRLDNEMSRILSSQTSDDAARWKDYQQVLLRFLRLVEEGRVVPSPETTDNDTKPSPSTRNESVFNEETIMSSVPQKYRTKAKLLFNALKNVPNNVFDWDDTGTVSIHGNRIERSNLIDLVNDAMRARKSISAHGVQEFAKMIRDCNMPREFIGNSSFWRSPERGGARLSVPVLQRTSSASPLPKTTASSSDSSSSTYMSDEVVEVDPEKSESGWKTLNLRKK